MVSCDVHTMEIRIAVKSLDLINLELQLSPLVHLFLLLNVVAIVKRDVDNTMSQILTCLHLTLGLVTRHQSCHSLVKSWHEDIVPLLLGEWMRSIHSQKQSLVNLHL